MSNILQPSWRGWCRKTRLGARPQLEPLEPRNLLTATPWPGLLHPVVIAPPAETLDAAPSLTVDLNDNGPAEVIGTLGNGPAGSADVNWFSFTLARPAHVTLDTLDRPGGSPLSSVLSLYAADDPSDPNLSFTMGGYRLAAQSDAAVSGGDAHLGLDLTACTYYVAVSGSGNRYFHPFVADSGLAGSVGAYGLRIASTDLATDPGPVTTWFADPIPANHGDDTQATARQLGDLSRGGLVQTAGNLGDNLADPNDPNQVDLYHFQIAGPGRFAFVSEVFAGRMGSPLDAGLSLFQLDTHGQFQLLSANDNSFNPTQATNNTGPPMFTDPVVYEGLTAGDYYVAISSSGNVPDPSAGLPGTNGIFDLNHALAGTNGGSTGNYVLNVLVQPVAQSPHVVAVSPGDGSTLTAPPTQFTIQFDEPVNLQQMVYQEFSPAAAGTVTAVYVQQGTHKYYPRLLSYDTTTNRATFLMLDALAAGTYELHLVNRPDAANNPGITDLAGNPLVGNTAAGDYVATFQVQMPQRGNGATPPVFLSQEPNNSAAQAQDLGVLFPKELQSGVVLQRNVSAGGRHQPHDTADYYQFQVLQSREYDFVLTGITGGPPPAGLQFSVRDTSGHTLPSLPWAPAGAAFLNLTPGIYRVSVSGWSPVQAADIGYQVTIALARSPENPAPLTVGPAPAVRLRLVSNQAPQSPPGNQAPPSTGGQDPGSGSQGSTPLTPIVTASGPGSTPITPPGPIAPAVATTFTATRNNLGLTGAIPSNVLQALAAGPIGGIGVGDRGTTIAFAERIALPGPQLAALETLLQTTILTQSGGAGDAGYTTGSSSIPDSTINAVREYITEGTRSVERLLDRLFSLGGWSLGPVPVPNNSTPGAEEQEPEISVPLSPGPERPDRDVVPDGTTARREIPPNRAPAWLGALLLVGAFATPGHADRKKRAAGKYQRRAVAPAVPTGKRIS